MNNLMKIKMDPFTGHRQAIEYTVMNPTKLKFYFNSSIELINSSINLRDFMKTKFNIEFSDDNSGITISEMNIFGQPNLKNVFKIIEKNSKTKYFKQMYIENHLIESIDENTFGKISFENIVLYCLNLKQIHCNAFGKHNNEKIKFISLTFNEDLRNQLDSDYDLFKLINSLVNCQSIVISSLYNKLQPIKLNKLKQISLMGFNSSKIFSICDYAFYQCDQLELIHLGWNHINYISKHAFHFRNTNKKMLKIYLCFNDLNEDSFAIDSLINFKRPVKLNLCANKLYYLKDEIFIPFLLLNQANKVKIDKQVFDENQKAKYRSQINRKYYKKIFKQFGMITFYLYCNRIE